jgi:hypothetical protein
MHVGHSPIPDEQWPQVALDAIEAARKAYVERTSPRADMDTERQSALTAPLRAAWQRGRIKRWLEAILSVANSQDEIAQTLMVTPASVSNWLSGAKGLQPHNAELLRRHFWPLLQPDSVPSETEVDCAGYRNAASECAAGGKFSHATQMTVLEFWTLWYLLRTAGWLQARQSGKKDRIAHTEQIVRRSVSNSLTRMGHKPFSGDCDSWGRHCDKTYRTWAVSWALTVAELDPKCWTPFS